MGHTVEPLWGRLWGKMRPVHRWGQPNQKQPPLPRPPTPLCRAARGSASLCPYPTPSPNPGVPAPLTVKSRRRSEQRNGSGTARLAPVPVMPPLHRAEPWNEAALPGPAKGCPAQMCSSPARCDSPNCARPLRGEGVGGEHTPNPPARVGGLWDPLQPNPSVIHHLKGPFQHDAPLFFKDVSNHPMVLSSLKTFPTRPSRSSTILKDPSNPARFPLGNGIPLG